MPPREMLPPARFSSRIETAVCPALLCLALTWAAPAVAQPRPAGAEDPVDDTLATPALDLTRMTLAPHGDTLAVSLRFRAPLEQAPFGFVDIDTDGDFATGARSAIDFLTGVDSGLGTDLHVSLATYDPVAGTVDLVDSEAGTVLDRISMRLDAELATLEIPMTLLPNAGSVALAAVVGTESAATDVAPNGGHLSTTQSEGGVLLQDQRFQVEVRWETSSGDTGSAREAVVSEDSAVLWFFHENNWEMLIKVLDGCAFNDHFWVFMGAATNVGFEIEVRDTATGVVRSYRNDVGQQAMPINDTSAFATCGGAS